jgi:tetratricopeptide (TPR) repeat protein
MSTETAETTTSTVSTGGVQSSSGSGVMSKATPILVAALAIVVAAGGWWWYSSNAEQENKEANLALSRVRALYVQGEGDKALTGEGLPVIDDVKSPGLRAIAEQYGSTPAGQLAALMAGNILANNGKAAEAKAYFETASESDAILVQVGAMNGLAACLEASGSMSEAAAKYEEAAKLGDKSGIEATSWLNAGVCYEKAGNKQKAIEALTIVVKKYATSDVVPSAKQALARLGTAID